MTIRPQDQYPGQVDTSDPNMPYGKFKNVVVDGDGSGTPLEKEWPNDIYGAFFALLDSAGITPNNIHDKIGASQFLDAFNARIGTAGNLISESGNMMSGAWTKHRGNISLQVTSPFEALFGDSGAKLYVVEAVGGVSSIKEFGLNPAYDETTVSHVHTKGLSSDLHNARTIDWNPDGSMIFAAGQNQFDTAEAQVIGYSCSTAWDLTTVSASSSQEWVCALFANGNITGIKFKPDGSKLFVSGYTGALSQAIGEYSVSTPFDITTAAAAPSGVISATDASNTGLCTIDGFDITEDGNTLFFTGYNTALLRDVLHEVHLPTAYSFANHAFQGRTRDMSYPGDEELRSLVFAVGDDSRASAAVSGNGAAVMSMYSSAVRVGS